MTAYRETCDACLARKIADETQVMQTLSPPPRKPIVWKGPVQRALTLVGIVAGFMASISLVYLGPIAILFWIPQFIACSIGSMNKYDPLYEWWKDLTWPQLLIRLAWFPMLLPWYAGMCCYRVVSRMVEWIRTGE